MDGTPPRAIEPAYSSATLYDLNIEEQVETVDVDDINEDEVADATIYKQCRTARTDEISAEMLEH